MTDLSNSPTNQTTSLDPVVAPLNAPEYGGNPFVADMEHQMTPESLFSTMGEAFKQGFTTTADLIKYGIAKNADFIGQSLDTLNPSGLKLMPSPKLLTKSQWQSSPWYRKGLDKNISDEGIYDNIAELKANQYDQDQLFQDELSRTNQGMWSKIAVGAAGFAGGVTDPGFVLMGALTDGTGLTAEISRLLPIFRDSEIATSSLRGGVIGNLYGTAYGTLGYAKGKEYSQSVSPLDILYSSLIGTGLGALGGAIAPILKSRFGQTLDQPKENYFEQPISADAQEAAAKMAMGQMENGLNPDVSDNLKQAYYEKQNTIEKQVNRASGQTQQEIDDIGEAKGQLQQNLDKINDQIKKETDPEELENLKSDRDMTQDQIDNYEAISQIKENPGEPVSVDQAKNTFQKIRTPQQESSYLPGDEIDYTPKSDEQMKVQALKEADDIQDKYKNTKEAMDNADEVDEETNKSNRKFDTYKKVYDGIRKCLLGE